MSNPLRDELEILRSTQRELRRQLEQLEHRIDEVADHLKRDEEAKKAPPVLAELPKPSPPPEPPPVPTAVAAPLPEPLPVKPESPAPAPLPEPPKATPPPPPPIAEPPPTPLQALVPTPPAKKSDEPMELRLGKFWLARIGIITFLTGLVFLSTQLYQSWIVHLGPGGKLSLLTLLACAMGASARAIYRWDKGMLNYARVLGAGACALGYYCAYAAHFVEPLRVIENPLAGGIVLLAVGLALTFVADLMKSQGTALLAILLSFYTASINPQPGFALLSNVILIAAAFALLLRNEWIALSFASLVAAYGSFAYWQFVRVIEGTHQELPTILGFLGAYWFLFTLCVFLSRSPKLRLAARASYLTTNNGAFFALASAALARYSRDDFWLFSLAFGIVLLLLSGLAWKKDREDGAFDGSYLAQGLALVALGLAAHFSGYQLGVIFAVESALLIYLSRLRHRWLLTVFSLLAAVGAWGLAFCEFEYPSHLLPAAFFLLAAGVLAKRDGLREIKPSALAAVYLLGALSLCGICAWKNLPGHAPIIVLSLTAVALAFGLRLHRLPELALGIQTYLLAADLLWATETTPPLSLTLLILATNLALMHWWQRQKALALSDETRLLGEILWALAVASLLYTWQRPYWDGPWGACYLATLALAILAYSLATRSGTLGLLGLLYSASATILCAYHLCAEPPHRKEELLAILLIALQHPLVQGLQGRLNEVLRSFVPYLLTAYRVLLFGLLVLFLFLRIPGAWQPVVLAAAAWLTLALLLWRKSLEPQAYASLLTLLFLGVFLCRTLERTDLGLYSVLPLLSIIALPLTAQRLPGTPLPSHLLQTLLLAALLELFLFTTLQVWDRGYGNFLAVAWALLAVLLTTAGFLVRERTIRLTGLAILTLAVLHVYIIDVWQTERIYCYLSFIILGALLLALSFLYNKITPLVRKWL